MLSQYMYMATAVPDHCEAHSVTATQILRPNKLTFLVLVSIPLKKWRCGANFLFFLSAVKSRGILMLTNMYLMVYEQYKFHLSIVCDM